MLIASDVSITITDSEEKSIEEKDSSAETFSEAEKALYGDYYYLFKKLEKEKEYD